jgi:hypothetical protein
MEIVKIRPLKLLFEGLSFHVPFQSGEGDRQPNMAANAQRVTQLKHEVVSDLGRT